MLFLRIVPCSTVRVRDIFGSMLDVVVVVVDVDDVIVDDGVVVAFVIVVVAAAAVVLGVSVWISISFLHLFLPVMA